MGPPKNKFLHPVPRKKAVYSYSWVKTEGSSLICCFLRKCQSTHTLTHKHKTNICPYLSNIFQQVTHDFCCTLLKYSSECNCKEHLLLVTTQSSTQDEGVCLCVWVGGGIENLYIALQFFCLMVCLWPFRWDHLWTTKTQKQR